MSIHDTPCRGYSKLSENLVRYFGRRLFVRGHDKTSESAYIAVYHKGSVPQFLKDHGFGPGNSIVQKAVSEAGWQKCSRCDYVGAPASVRNHEKKCTTTKEN